MLPWNSEIENNYDGVATVGRSHDYFVERMLNENECKYEDYYRQIISVLLYYNRYKAVLNTITNNSGFKVEK